MKKFNQLLWVIIFISSCKPGINKASYNSIELSSSNGSPFAFSLRIDSNNVIKKCDYQIVNDINSTKCFCDTLSQNLVDSLNYFVSKINQNKPASKYEERCHDCDMNWVKIKLPGQTIESLIVGNKHKVVIASLVEFIKRNSSNLKIESDSTYKFSLTKNLIPPKLELDTTTVFIPPTQE